MKTRKIYDTEYKKKIVQEYTAGALTAEQIAEREGLSVAMVYKWKSQLENRARSERIETLEATGHNADDVRKMMELEDEIEAYKVKVAELTIINDLLKKIHPSFQSGKRSSGYSELKREVSKSKGRVK